MTQLRIMTSAKGGNPKAVLPEFYRKSGEFPLFYVNPEIFMSQKSTIQLITTIKPQHTIHQSSNCHAI